MTFLPARKLTQEVMLGQIEQVLRRGPETDVPAYTLILGAGASYGSVPTARQMLGLPEKGVIHPQSIPLYLHELDTGAAPAENERAGVVADFWRRLLEANPDLLREATTDGQTQIPVKLKGGLPDAESIPNAYKHIFSQQRTGGLNTASDAREYIRRLTLPKGQQTRLNGTHFYLASLLSLQDQRGRAGEPSAYVGKRPFARTIFTTNFDPLLQVSLQLFQLLYYMTDRPDQLTADALHTDGHPVVHLFYAHGSVHRPFLANTDSEIGHVHKNAQGLSGYLSQHGVIVLGYAGWDDCLLRALKQTGTFANNLYWLARGESSLAEDVKEFLASHPNAHWVDISDGGQWMEALHRRLCPSMRFTELLTNPIPFLRRRIERVDLSTITPELQESQVQPIADGNVPISIQPSDQRTTSEEYRSQVIELLSNCEQTFEELSGTTDTQTRLIRLEHMADLAYGQGNWSEAREFYNAILQEGKVPEKLQAKVLFRRAFAAGQLALPSEALADYQRMLEMTGPPIELVAKALLNRGALYGMQGNRGAAIAEFGRVIEMPGSPPELVLQALINRGIAYREQGNRDAAIAEFRRVIEMPGAPPEPVLQAVINRAIAYRDQGNRDAAKAEFGRAIEMPGTPPVLLAQALYNRGSLYWLEGATEETIADCTRVLEIPSTPSKMVAQTLYNRAEAYREQGKIDAAIADYSRMVEIRGAPSELVAQALYNRGILQTAQGKTAAAMADYRRVIETSGTSAELVAKALYNRGVLYSSEGNCEAAISDWVRVIDTPGMPADLLSMALYNRGVAYRRQGMNEAGIADYARVIAMPGASCDLVEQALRNRAKAYKEQGKLDAAETDLERADTLRGLASDKKPDSPAAQRTPKREQ